ncbi:MAG: ECF transporter S component [Lachnospiraceae bacterium]|jgi:uncharacterized membrane protein
MNSKAGRNQSAQGGSLKVRKKTADLVLLAFFTAIIIFMSITPFGYIPLGVINATIVHVPVILGAVLLGPGPGAFLGFIFGLTSFLKNTYMPSTLSAFVFSPVLAYSTIGPSGIWKSAFICFVPRILVGVLPYYVFKGVGALNRSKMRNAGLAALDILVSVLIFIGVRAFTMRAGMAGVPAAVIGVACGAVVFVLVFRAVRRQKGDVLAYTLAGITGALTNTLIVMPSIYILYKDSYAAALSISPDAVLTVILGVISFNGVIEAIIAGVLTLGIGKPLQRARNRNM